MFVVPIVFIVLTMQMNSKAWKVTVGIVDNDNTEFTEIIKDKIEENGQYIEIQEGDIQKDLIESNVDYVLSIDKGFTEKLINGEDVSLKGYGIKETNASMPFKIYMESFLNSSKDIAIMRTLPNFAVIVAADANETKAARETGKIITVEEHNIIGGDRKSVV